MSSTYERLGAVAVFNVDAPTDPVSLVTTIRYRCTVYHNPRCLPAVAVPETLQLMKHDG